MNLLKLLLITFASLLVSGCCGPVQSSHIQPYTGPTDSMAKVVADINANNSKVPTLWAHHYYEADVVDDKHQSHHVSGDGNLLFIAPNDMRLTANAVIGTVFDLGSNPQTFWMKTGPDTGDTMWWGDHAEFAKLNPEDIDMPFRPDMVLDVLGIAVIDTNFNVRPAPSMRFDAYADAYVFIWNRKLADRWVAVREVWYDRATKLPKLVLMYDTNGRVVLRAEFNDPRSDIDGRPVLNLKFYRQVELPGVPKTQWPWIPGNYHLDFPGRAAKFTFTLDQAELKRKVDDVYLPDPRSFIMPSTQNADVNRVIQIGH